MQYKYHTKSGCVYVRTVDVYGDDWVRLVPGGRPEPLAGAMHVTRRRLQELITDYPVNVLDHTALIGRCIAKEFFDDVEREGGVCVSVAEDSTIFFLVDRGEGQYSLGHSSRVERIETSESIEAPERAVKRY